MVVVLRSRRATEGARGARPDQVGLEDCRSGQGVEHWGGGEMRPGRVNANGGDGTVAGGVKAVGAAACRTVAAPPLWQTHAVFTGLIGRLHFQRVSCAGTVLQRSRAERTG